MNRILLTDKEIAEHQINNGHYEVLIAKAQLKKVAEWFDDIYRKEYRMVSKSSSDSDYNELLIRLRQALLKEVEDA